MKKGREKGKEEKNEEQQSTVTVYFLSRVQRRGEIYGIMAKTIKKTVTKKVQHQSLHQRQPLQIT